MGFHPRKSPPICASSLQCLTMHGLGLLFMHVNMGKVLEPLQFNMNNHISASVTIQGTPKVIQGLLLYIHILKFRIHTEDKN